MMLKNIGLFALFCSLLGSPYLQLASGDPALLAQICAKTPEPGYCQQCFQSDPSNVRKNATELGLATIACSYTQSLVVNNDLDGYISNSTDPQFKQVCITCKSYIISALSNVAIARQSWVGGNFKRASNLIGVALADYQRCNQQIGNRLFPPQFGIDFSTLKGFYRVAIAVLLQI